MASSTQSNRTNSVASPFLVSAPATRRPRLPALREAVDRFRCLAEEQFQNLLRKGDGPP